MLQIAPQSRTMNNLIPHSPGVLRLRNTCVYKCVARISHIRDFEREYLTRASPWISEILNERDNSKWKYEAKSVKTRETPSVGLRYVVALTLHNHAIINTNHSWGDRGRMIHRRDMIVQRATRVEFRDKGESAPRRAHATGSPGTFTQSSLLREVFLTWK